MEKTLKFTKAQLSVLGQCLHHHILKVETDYDWESPHARGYLGMCEDLLYCLLSAMNDEDVKKSKRKPNPNIDK